jgi:hypothetical protein
VHWVHKVQYVALVRFSRTLAYAGGVVLPIVETIRRWHQLGDLRMAPMWLDDWIIGLFLLYGAWRTRDGASSGRAVLAAAWGVACGMGYMSFFGELSNLGLTDPSGLPSITVAVIKGVMVALALAALVLTLRR